MDVHNMELQSHLNSTETLRAKQSFESVCSAYGVVPQNYIYGIRIATQVVSGSYAFERKDRIASTWSESCLRTTGATSALEHGDLQHLEVYQEYMLCGEEYLVELV